jgi:hypothetical protein
MAGQYLSLKKVESTFQLGGPFLSGVDIHRDQLVGRLSLMDRLHPLPHQADVHLESARRVRSLVGHKIGWWYVTDYDPQPLVDARLRWPDAKQEHGRSRTALSGPTSEMTRGTSRLPPASPSRALCLWNCRPLSRRRARLSSCRRSLPTSEWHCFADLWSQQARNKHIALCTLPPPLEVAPFLVMIHVILVWEWFDVLRCVRPTIGWS